MDKNSFITLCPGAYLQNFLPWSICGHSTVIPSFFVVQNITMAINYCGIVLLQKMMALL